MPNFRNSNEVPTIRPSDVLVAIKMMKENKVDGLKRTVVERRKTVEGYGIRKLIDVISKIHDEGTFVEDPRKSIIIALLKKLGVVACERYHAASFLSHATKIILRILVM